MPAKSKKQQMAAGAALAAKRGERSKSSLKGASRQMAKSMSENQLRDFAKTKRKRLPRKKTSRDPDPTSKSGRDRKIDQQRQKPGSIKSQEVVYLHAVELTDRVPQSIVIGERTASRPVPMTKL